MTVRDEQTEWLRVQLYRRMTPQERILIAAQMFEDGVSIVRSSILDRHPEISPEDLHYQIRRRVLPRGFAELPLCRPDGRVREGDTTMAQHDVLFRVLDALEALNIPYMIVGSFASNYWGRPRTTHGVDLVIEIPSDKVADLAHLLGDEFYAPDFVIQEAARRREHFNVISMKHPFKVDLWMRKDTPYDRACFQRRHQGTMFHRRVWVASAEDTILSKLLWYRTSPVLQRQWQDALEVYEIQEPDLDQAYLDHWAAALGVADLLAQIRQQAALPPESEGG